MRQLSYKRHRFSADIMRHSIWLYARFTLSYRDVEEMLAERVSLVKTSSAARTLGSSVE
jgi:transposase-like protein